MTPQEQRTYKALVDFQRHCARVAESFEESKGFIHKWFFKGPKNRGHIALQNSIAEEIRKIELTTFYTDEPPPLVRSDRVQVKESAGFSRGSKGVVKYITPIGEIWVERDGSGSDMMFHRDELDLLP